VDRHLKERLIGAAVLIAAAIILIPEMLSGPHDSVPSRADLPAHDADANGAKTYTIDLSAPPAQVAEQPAEAAQTFVETTPSPEAPVQEVQIPVVGDAVQASPPAVQSVREREQRLLEEFSAQVKPTAKPVEKTPAAETAVAKLESVPAVHNTGGWVVQVASFGVRATSDRIAAELKAKGHPAFVVAFAVKGQTMYRVRVGPVADRAAAEALLKKIKPLHPDAAVASQ
jgi:DedD protein